MSEQQAKVKREQPSGGAGRESGRTRRARPSSARPPQGTALSGGQGPGPLGASGSGLLGAAGPGVTLGPPIQRKVAFGRSGDAYEREAEAAADRIASGGKVTSLSRLRPGGLGAGEPQGPAGSGAAVQREAEEDEEAVQTAPAPGAVPLQRAADEDEEPVQMAQAPHAEPIAGDAGGMRTPRAPHAFLMRKAADEDEEPVQARGGGPGGDGPAMQAAASRALQQRGAGRPMEPGTRRTLEAGFGADLSHVRVHEGPAAAGAARALNARAFTSGPDIWLGPGQSQQDLHLMAHETAHVIQQGGATPAVPAVQRAEEDETGGGTATDTSEEREADASGNGEDTGVLEGDTIRFEEIEIPTFKLQDHRGELYGQRQELRRKKDYKRGRPGQRQKWKNTVAAEMGDARQEVEAKIREAKGVQTVDPTETYVLTGPSGIPRQRRFLVGDLPTLMKELTIPSWTREGRGRRYHVDHIVELQLANWNADTWANELANMELLEEETNTASGRTIKNRINAKVRAFIDATDGQYGRRIRDIKKRYHLAFRRAVPDGSGEIGPDMYWTRSQITDGEHLGPVRVGSLADLGEEDRVLLFHSAAGGVGKKFRWRGGNTPARPTSREARWLAPYRITRVSFDTDEGSVDREEFGKLYLNIPRNSRDWHQLPQDEEISVNRIPGARYAGYLNRWAVWGHMRKLRQKKTSPITVDSLDIHPEDGLVASGAILPETPLLQGVQLGYELRGDDLTARAELSPEEIQVPAPLSVTDSSMVISLGTRSGIGIEGQVDFGIENVGQGHLRGAAGARDGLALEGSFDFDTDLFERASITVRYRDDQFSGEGDLTIGSGKVRGVRSGTVHVAFEEGRLNASGTVEPEIPGVQQASLTAEYVEGEGLLIGGELELTDQIPGIRGGRIDAAIRKREDRYDVTATGTAQPDIPGVDTALEISYESGLFDIRGSAAYERGMLSGTVEVGVTNRPLDESGNVAGSEPGEELRAYGGGSVTMEIAPWLQATVGLRLLPNGEMEVSGEVGLPDTVDLFPEKAVERTLFRPPPIDIPIVGVSAMGQRIGIFATIRGGLEGRASIGPGQLRELNLGVTYNPDHEDQTRVEGSAELHIPAEAGLRLFVRGGIGAGIPVVSASANLEIGGQMGLEGAVSASVQVDWTPAAGLELQAQGEIYAQPKFRFDITGMVLVELSLLLDTVELYRQDWELASFEYGSDYRVGLRFPVHYKEGEPFDIGVDDVEFDVPEIDVEELLRDLVDRIA